ncbi:MAG: hypothetical protein AAF685_16055 [Cyanobacteria bacterium P01_C01_bin.89]
MVAPTDAKLHWTSADLESFTDTGDRYEIIGGDLYVTRAPHARHQKVGLLALSGAAASRF